MRRAEAPLPGVTGTGGEDVLPRAAAGPGGGEAADGRARAARRVSMAPAAGGGFGPLADIAAGAARRASVAHGIMQGGYSGSTVRETEESAGTSAVSARRPSMAPSLLQSIQSSVSGSESAESDESETDEPSAEEFRRMTSGRRPTVLPQTLECCRSTSNLLQFRTSKIARGAGGYLDSTAVLTRTNSQSKLLSRGGSSVSLLSRGDSTASLLSGGDTSSNPLQRGGSSSSLLQRAGQSLLQRGGSSSNLPQRAGSSSSLLQRRESSVTSLNLSRSGSRASTLSRAGTCNSLCVGTPTAGTPTGRNRSMSMTPAARNRSMSMCVTRAPARRPSAAPQPPELPAPPACSWLLLPDTCSASERIEARLAVRRAARSSAAAAAEKQRRAIETEEERSERLEAERTRRASMPDVCTTNVSVTAARASPRSPRTPRTPRVSRTRHMPTGTSEDKLVLSVTCSRPITAPRPTTAHMVEPAGAPPHTTPQCSSIRPSSPSRPQTADPTMPFEKRAAASLPHSTLREQGIVASTAPAWWDVPSQVGRAASQWDGAHQVASVKGAVALERLRPSGRRGSTPQLVSRDFERALNDIRRNKYLVPEAADPVRAYAPRFKARKRLPIESSIWAPRRKTSDARAFIDTEAVEQRAFEADWRRATEGGRLARFIIKNDDDADDRSVEPSTGDSHNEVREVKECLRKHHRALCSAFNYFACTATGYAFSINFNEFMLFCESSAIPDARSTHCKKTHLDQLFIAVNASASGTALEADKMGKSLNRAEFMQAIVRVAVQKYVLPGRILDVSDAIEELMTRCVLRNLAIRAPEALQDSNAFRQRYCYLEQVLVWLRRGHWVACAMSPRSNPNPLNAGQRATRPANTPLRWRRSTVYSVATKAPCATSSRRSLSEAAATRPKKEACLTRTNGWASCGSCRGLMVRSGSAKRRSASYGRA